MSRIVQQRDRQPAGLTPLADGFADALIYAVASERGQQFTGRPLTEYNGAVPKQTEAAGMAWDLAPSNAYVDLGAVPENDGVTAICVARQNANVNNFIFSTRTGSTAGFEFLCNAVGSVVLRRIGNVSTPAATGLNDGRFHAYAGSFSSTRTDLTVDGDYIGVAPGATTFSHPQNCFIGRRGSTYFNGEVAMLAIFLRQFEPEEQMALTRELLSVYRETLKPRVRYRFFTQPSTPTLSLPGVIDIGTTSARPQVTLTY